MIIYYYNLSRVMRKQNALKTIGRKFKIAPGSRKMETRRMLKYVLYRVKNNNYYDIKIIISCQAPASQKKTFKRAFPRENQSLKPHMREKKMKG